MLELLISSTVLILALTALRFFLRGKLNPRLQYALWLLAALRLLLPVSLVRSPVSVMNAVPDVPAAVQRLTAPENRRAPQTDNTQSPVQTASETETAPTEAQMQHAVEHAESDIKASLYRSSGTEEEIVLHLTDLSENERRIILAGSLINFYN